MFKIIKRTHTTLSINNISIFDSIFKMPKCSNCIYYKNISKCKYFSTYTIFARLDGNKCGIDANKFISKY